MKRKIAILLTSVLLVGAVLSGCGSEGGTQTEEAKTEASGAEESKTEEKEETAEADTLTVLVSSTTYSDAQKAIYEGFTEATGIKTDIQVVPGETAQYQQIVQSKLLTEDYPDMLVYFGEEARLTQLQADQHMRELTNQEYIDRVADGIYNVGGTFKGKTYGLPFSGVDFCGLLYNQDIFDDLGITAPTTYDELTDVCQQIVDSGTGIIPIYEMGKQGGPLQAFNFTNMAPYFASEEGAETIAKVNAGEMKFEDTPILECYEQKMALQDAGYMNDKTDMMSGTWDTMFEALGNEKAAMSFVFSNMLPNFYQSYPDTNIDMTSLNGAVSGTCTQFIFALNTGNTVAQDAFYEYLLSGTVLEDYYSATSMVPAYKDMNADLKQPLQTMYKLYTSSPFSQNYADRFMSDAPTRIALLQEMHVRAKTPLEVCQQETIEYAKVMEARGE